MNVLFLTIGQLNDIEEHSLYPDLLRKFRDMGHSVYAVSPYERRTGKNTEYKVRNGFHSLKVKVGNITKCSMIEKGISTVLIESQYKRAIKKYLSRIKFDLVLYSTPPITLTGVIDFIKRRDNARSYLMLKDIFPQNAVDIGIMTASGIKGVMYKFFRSKEKKLYALSDTIGCMSEANRTYLLSNNPSVDPAKVEICPNCIDMQDISLTADDKQALRKKYSIPEDRKVLIYGGNLGKPQDIPFIIECLKALEHRNDLFILIVGDGTEYSKLRAYFDTEKPQNMQLLCRLDPYDYDRLISVCDLGLIFLHHGFTIPNFPSRILSYMQAGIPTLACTDPSTDMGKVIVEGGFGFWCESNSVQNFVNAVDESFKSDLKAMGEKGYLYLKNNYTTQHVYDIITAEKDNESIAD